MSLLGHLKAGSGGGAGVVDSPGGSLVIPLSLGELTVILAGVPGSDW